jgi:hypothetical protein
MPFKKIVSPIPIRGLFLVFLAVMGSEAYAQDKQQCGTQEDLNNFNRLKAACPGNQAARSRSDAYRGADAYSRAQTTDAQLCSDLNGWASFCGYK